MQFCPRRIAMGIDHYVVTWAGDRDNSLRTAEFGAELTKNFLFRNCCSFAITEYMAGSSGAGE